MNLNPSRYTEACRFQDSRPEQRMEVDDVFSNEVMDLCVTALPPVFQFFIVGVTPLLSRTDIANRGVEPDVPIVARRVRNLESKIRSRS